MADTVQNGWTWGDDGVLKGPGVGGAVIKRLDLDTAQARVAGNNQRISGIMGIGMGGSNQATATQLDKSISRFMMNKDGSLKGFVAELEAYRPQGMADWNRAGQMVQAYTPSIMGMKGEAKGAWVGVEGIKLDPSTLSGRAEGDITFEDNNGPLAVFKSDGRVNGYMRLATNAAKAADKINLSNKTGKATPQQSSTRSILGGAR